MFSMLLKSYSYTSKSLFIYSAVLLILRDNCHICMRYVLAHYMHVLFFVLFYQSIGNIGMNKQKETD